MDLLLRSLVREFNRGFTLVLVFLGLKLLLFLLEDSTLDLFLADVALDTEHQ